MKKIKYFTPELKNLFRFETDNDGFVCGVWLKNPMENLLDYLGSDVIEALEEETRQEMSY